jgi:hypothetical protein
VLFQARYSEHDFNEVIPEMRLAAGQVQLDKV